LLLFSTGNDFYPTFVLACPRDADEHFRAEVFWGCEDTLTYKIVFPILSRPSDSVKKGKGNMKKVVSIVCMIMLSGMFLIPHGAAAFDVDDLQRAITKKSCANCNLTMADLSKVDLSRANLRGANLTGARLTGTNLYRANLSYANLGGADLSYADLHRANLDGANLAGANLSHTIWTDRAECQEGSISDCPNRARTAQQSQNEEFRLPF